MKWLNITLGYIMMEVVDIKLGEKFTNISK